MYICKECEKVFTEDEMAVWQEGRGEFWGQPCDETVYGCPYCKSDFVEAKQCKSCGEWIKVEDWDICEECLNEYMTKEICLEMGEENASEIKLNDFILSNFSKEEIEQILLQKLQENAENIEKAVKEYCEADMLYFVNWVENKWKEEK